MPSQSLRRRAVAALLGLGALAPAAARADCVSMAEVIRPYYRDSAPNEIQLFLSIGNAISVDSGATWKLQCEAIYQPPGSPVGPANMQLTPEGTIVFGHFVGLLTSKDQGCTFLKAAGLPTFRDGDTLPLLDVALDAGDPNHRFWTVATDNDVLGAGGKQNPAAYVGYVLRSDDGGQCTKTITTFCGHQMLRIATSPADPKFVYATSFTPAGAGLALFIHGTADGGATWTTYPSPFGADEFLLARVSATDGHRIYAIRGAKDQTLHALDVGPSAIADTLIFQVQNPAILASDRKLSVALGAAKGELWVGVKGDDGFAGTAELHHSLDDGKTWTKVSATQPHFRCLELQGGMLWGCGNNLTATGDTFAVGVSSDGGMTWSKKFAFGELCHDIAPACDYVLTSSCIAGLCTASSPPPALGPSCAKVGTSPSTAACSNPPVSCPGAVEAPVEMAAEPPLDASADAPGKPPRTGCCRTGGDARSSPSAALALTAGLGLGVLRRRRR